MIIATYQPADATAGPSFGGFAVIELTAERMIKRGYPSSLKHLAYVEDWWFVQGFAGRLKIRPELYEVTLDFDSLDIEREGADQEVSGTLRQFPCKYHAWRYDTTGACRCCGPSSRTTSRPTTRCASPRSTRCSTA